MLKWTYPSKPQHHTSTLHILTSYFWSSKGHCDLDFLYYMTVLLQFYIPMFIRSHFTSCIQHLLDFPFLLHHSTYSKSICNLSLGIFSICPRQLILLDFINRKMSSPYSMPFIIRVSYNSLLPSLNFILLLFPKFIPTEKFQHPTSCLYVTTGLINVLKTLIHNITLSILPIFDNIISRF